MKKFLAVYMGSKNSASGKRWEALDAETKKKKEAAGMEGWKKWGMASGKAIVEMGCPLGKTKKIGPEGISDIKNEIVAYTVVQAETHEAAAKLFINHPHFAIFPGDSVEMMECLSIPGM